jgi:hypothetical protein
MSASFSNLTLIPWVPGALLILWVLILLKRVLYHTPGRQMFWVTSHATITRTSNIKDLGVFCNSKLHFHNHADFIFSEYIKLLGLIRTVTLIFLFLECLYVLYFTLIRSKLEYASVVWNSITSTNAKELERIQQKFASVCVSLPFPRVPYSCTFALEKSSLHSLLKRRHHLDALFFFVQVYRGFKSCPFSWKMLIIVFLLGMLGIS